MKTQTLSQRIRAPFAVRILVAAALLVLAGCVTQRVVWSPDGKQAAVLSEDGLYLCDAEGTISGLLLPDVTAVAWFQDSRRLAVDPSVTCTNWQGLAVVLSPQGRENIKSTANELLARLQPGNRDQVLEAESGSDKSCFSLVSCICAMKGAPPTLKLLEGAKQFKDLKVEVSTLSVAQVTNGALELGQSLFPKSETSGRSAFPEQRCDCLYHG